MKNLPRQRKDNWTCVTMREKVGLLLKTLIFKQTPVKIIFVLQLCNLIVRKEPGYSHVGRCHLLPEALTISSTSSSTRRRLNRPATTTTTGGFFVRLRHLGELLVPLLSPLPVV
jgi:hypothetical protein